MLVPAEHSQTQRENVNVRRCNDREVSSCTRRMPSITGQWPDPG